MISAGQLDHRVRLERRAAGADDGYGNVLQAWATLGIRWAGWRPQYGREGVAAGRLESSRPGVLTLRRDAVTLALTAADRIVFLAGTEAANTVAAIRSVLPFADAVEVTVEIGVAT